MLRLHHLHAEPGMVVAAEVRHPRHAHIILLRPGAVLDRAAIAHLREIRVRDLWIKYPTMQNLGAAYSPEVSAAAREVTSRLGKAIDDHITDRHAKLDYNVFRDAMAALLDTLAMSPKAAMYMMELSGAASAHVRHAANTCFLSMLLGMKLDFYLIRERGKLSPGLARELTALGAGAMLHDIGLLSLPDETLARYEETGDESDPAWREHTTLGFHTLRTEFEAAVGATALHHHQHFDGTGFPPRTLLDGRVVPLSGSEIHVFARIVAVADMMDRLRFHGHTILSPPRLEPAMPVVRALKALIASPLSARFDPVILRTLLTVVPPFAPGSMVTLSDGRSALVASWTPLDPCRPCVEIIPTSGGGRWWENPPKERLDLQQDSDTTIVWCDEVDVRNDVFYPSSPREFDPIQASGPVQIAA